MASDLATIVRNATAQPTIVNAESRFVVVTYWWGRGNWNKNIARPCVDFYESLLLQPYKIIQSYELEPRENFNWALWFDKEPNLREFYRKQAEKYVREMPEPRATSEEVLMRFLPIVRQSFIANKDFIHHLLRIQRARRTFEGSVANLRAQGKQPRNSNVEEAKGLVATYTFINDEIKKSLRRYIVGTPGTNGVLTGGLEQALGWLPPIKYEDMIRRWEEFCAAAGCNHLAIEYPEFARPGGYQLAINAKPLFIQKALELCAPRAVVYIDGDMTMNRYPHIFDATDIDYMARGWNIDPRSSWKHTMGEIMVDPYVFETSGGIMYFSQSPESQTLLREWILESAKPHNQGKADDRIISLFFNTKRLLAPMKILQLPVEYLWLSMSYDYSIEGVNRDQIYIEHPECLTSEDTATSSGAAGDRSPKFYSALQSIHPRSEMLYESVMFPSLDVANEFRPWLDYMRDVTYPEDADTDIAGESPFYVEAFGSFGDKQEVYDRNIAAFGTAPSVPVGRDRVAYFDADTLTIPTVLKHLSEGHTIVYIPTTAYDKYLSALNALRRDVRRNRIEFAFVDTNSNFSPEYAFQYEIDLDQPFLIRPGNPLLFTLFALLDEPTEIKTMLKNNYQFLSRIRCHIMKPARMHGGNSNKNTSPNTNNRSTEEATNILYGITGGGRRTYKRRPARGYRRTRKN